MISLANLGRLLVLIGIGLAVAKYLFSIEEVGSWTLLALLPGVVLTMIGDRKTKKTANG